MLRGLAACAVVFLHAYGEGAEYGAAGVDLFFVISGFIMASIPKRPTFLLDRVWRIFPMWLLAVSAWLLWYGADSWQSVVSSLTLWPVYRAIVPPALPVGWTLCFEMLFYCALAWSLRVGAKAPLAMFALAFAGGFLMDAPLLHFLGSPMILEFLFGALIAKCPLDKRLAVPLLAFAVTILLGSPSWLYDNGIAFDREAILRVGYWGVPAALIVYAALANERLFRDWDIPVLLGNASYSIYLFHLIVMRALHLHWALEMTLVILAGVGVWWAVERRLIAWRNTVMKVARSGRARSDGSVADAIDLPRIVVVERHNRIG